jgi:hypothetical protein
MGDRSSYLNRGPYLNGHSLLVFEHEHISGRWRRFACVSIRCALELSTGRDLQRGRSVKCSTSAGNGGTGAGASYWRRF